MKKLLVLPALVAAVFFFACSDDSSSSSAKHESLTEELPEGDSTRVLVYSYDKFLSPKDVSILDEDTISISIDTTLAKKGAEDDDEMPRVGNVIVIWEAVNKTPYYLRVKSVNPENDRLVMKVDKATPFEAIPKGDYHFSTEIFFDTRKMTDNGDGDVEIGADVFYDEENATYHPIVFINGQSDENGESAEYSSFTDNPFYKNFDETGVIDMRKALKSNFSVNKSAQLYDFDISFTPGVIEVTGVSSELKDYKSAFSENLFAKALSKWGDKDKKDDGKGEKDDGKGEKDDGKDDDDDEEESLLDAAKAYIKIGTIRYKSSGSAHLNINTTWWGRPELFEVYFKGTTVVTLDSLGLGLGIGIDGQKQLTNWTPKSVVFQIGPVPVAIDFTWNLYFKYELSSYALLTYPINFIDSTTKKFGMQWKREGGFHVINDKGGFRDFNAPKSFMDFVNQSRMAAVGEASVGIYLRIGAMIYGAGGPTVGLGARLDLDVETSTSGKALFDDEGSWVESNDVAGHINLDLAFPLELGGRIQIPVLNKTLFEKNYDVADLYSIPLLDLNTADK